MNESKNSSKFDHLLEHLIGFLDAKSEILKLELKEELIKILSRLVAGLILVVLVALVLLFSSVAVGNYLNQLWASSYLGYGAMAGSFFMLCILVFLLRQTPWYHNIIGYFTDKILTGIGEKHDETNIKD